MEHRRCGSARRQAARAPSVSPRWSRGSGAIPARRRRVPRPTKTACGGARGVTFCGREEYEARRTREPLRAAARASRASVRVAPSAKRVRTRAARLGCARSGRAGGRRAAFLRARCAPGRTAAPRRQPAERQVAGSAAASARCCAAAVPALHRAAPHRLAADNCDARHVSLRPGARARQAPHGRTQRPQQQQAGACRRRRRERPRSAMGTTGRAPPATHAPRLLASRRLLTTSVR